MSIPYAALINLFHIIVVSPFLAYLYYKRCKNEPLPDSLYTLIIILAFVVLIYHAYRFTKNIKKS